jgi:hypothetical protein
MFPREAREQLEVAGRATRGLLFSRWWTRLEAAVKACGSSLDQAKLSLRRAPQWVCEDVSHVGLAVAAVGSAGARVQWHVQTARVLTSQQR